MISNVSGGMLLFFGLKIAIAAAWLREKIPVNNDRWEFMLDCSQRIWGFNEHFSGPFQITMI